MRNRKQDVIDALPGTAREVCDKTGMSFGGASEHLLNMHMAQEVHVTGWMRDPRPDGRGKWARVFTYGRGIDAPCPLPPKKNRFKSRAPEVLKALELGPADAIEVGKRTGMPPNSARRHLANLHDEDKVHVSGWLLEGGPPFRVFSRGRGVDAPNPYAKQDVVYRARATRKPPPQDRYFDNKVARDEAKKWADKAAKGLTMDPLLAHLFGRAA